MVIWSGWGILTVVIVMLVGGPVTAILANLAGPGNNTAGYALVAGLLVSAVVNWFVGRRLNSAPGRELVDPATGERVLLRTRHSLFFVPMQWWSVVIAAAATVALGAMLFGNGGNSRSTAPTGLERVRASPGPVAAPDASRRGYGAAQKPVWGGEGVVTPSDTHVIKFSEVT